MDKKKIILLALVAVAAYFIFTKLGKKSDAGESGDETESADGTGDGEEAAGNTSGSSGSTPAKNEWWDKYEPARKLIDKNQPIYIYNATGTKNFFTGAPGTIKLAHLNGGEKHYMEVMKLQTAGTINTDALAQALRSSKIIPVTYSAPSVVPQLKKGDNLYIRCQIYEDKTAGKVRIDTAADMKLENDFSFRSLMNYLYRNYMNISQYSRTSDSLMVLDIVNTNIMEHYKILRFINRDTVDQKQSRH